LVGAVEVVDGLEIDSTREALPGGRQDAAAVAAARADVIQMLRLLISRGASVNARDGSGRAPIHQAVGSGLYDVTGMRQSVPNPRCTCYIVCYSFSPPAHAARLAVARSAEMATRGPVCGCTAHIVWRGLLAPLNIAPRQGCLLTCASDAWCVRCTEMLLNAHADPNGAHSAAPRA
jgi:ankyrin repeat protein